ncbi:phospholipase D-like domain-containing protein [Echinimonas agarilytica]|uniref:Phospholipase D family protein n=1 Tax=Echinimonas agarilytica TaxID=1215918 RepID=A0AA42B9C4_9GAMM|nr:phospholipase D family protein [Echinimonas agarilytica]MCM2681026.1 phospholipase D family protein [Echinimonas agarilytica]
MKSSSIIRIPRQWKSQHSDALSADQNTRIGQQITCCNLHEKPGAGMRLVSREDDAIAIRLQLIDQADRSLDMQYYKWLDDNGGSLILSHVIAAADRGVRVRLLIDDIHFDSDVNAQALDAHPNIEIRLFNPFESRRMTPLTRPLEWLRNDRVNHRMHNKLIVADNLVALCGGRNISDSYFGLSERITFRDLDLVVIGEVIQEMSDAFDSFWNSRWAVPVSLLVKVSLPERQRQRFQAMLRRFKRSRQYGKGAKLQELANHQISNFTENLIWAPAHIIYDKPSKVRNSQGKKPSRVHQFNLLLDALEQVNQSIHVITPYLIPTPGMLALLATYKLKGVKVSILTNSLASNDVVMAHGGYAHYRKQLLQCGVKLYELSPSARFNPPSIAPYSLHAKTLVLDGKAVFIGTHNADPRSIHLNTEMGILVDSIALSVQVLQVFDEHTTQGNSWRVFIRFGAIFWRRQHKGRTQLKRHEPETHWRRRWLAKMCGWLPIHKQL